MLKLENGQRDLYHKLLERLVMKKHQYRKLRGLIDFKELLKPLHELYSHTGKPKMNNSKVGDYSSDPDARFGCKGKNKFWLGYMRHNRVDMKQGLISKVAVTSANVSDAQAFIDEGMCPDEEM